MAGLRKRLLALANGQTDLDAVVSSVEADARQSLSDAENILDELDEAYKDNTLDLESFSVLKKSVLTTITTLDSEDPGLDFDLTQESPAMADPDEKTLVTDTSHYTNSTQSTQSTQSTAITAVPGAEHTGPIEVGPGTLLRGRFYIDEVLGKGGMGTVYKGRDALKLEAQDRNPHVAVKVLNEDIKQRSDAFIALQREASRQQRLAHPNIATVYDFDRVGGLIFITMELLEGIPLDEYMKAEVKPKGGISFEEALPLVRSLSSALDYAHDNNIIHSDFKPSNCFLTKDKDIKILDFGIARAVRTPEQAEQTLFDGSKLGAMTPSYASFEMLESSGDPHPGDDVYALACVTYELLTGKHPFNRLPANVAAENNLEPAPIPGLTRAQNRALAKGLAFHRENRSPSAQSFLEGLSGGSGAPASKMWRIAAIGGVLVVVAIGAGFGMSQYRQGQLNDIAEGLSSPDVATVESSLSLVESLDAADRQYVLNDQSVKNRLTAYFEKQIQTKTTALDYPGIEAALARARTLYGDSARIENAAQNAIEQKNLLLGELSETYEGLLEGRKLLPTDDGNDLPGIIEKLKKIDPESALISDPRLASSYAKEADRLISEYEFDQAKKIIDVGSMLAVGHPALVNVQDRLNKEQSVADQRARAQELEIKLAPNVAGSRTLASFNDIATDLSALAAVAPDSPVIAKARENLGPAVEGALSELKAKPDIAALVAIEENYAALLSAIGMTALSERVTAARSAAVSRVDDLATGVSDAIALGNLDSPAKTNATEQLATLRDLAPTDERVDQLQAQLINAYISRANDQKLAGSWDEARNQIALARRLSPGADLEAALQTELASIDETQSQAAARTQAENEEKAARDRQARIAALENQIKSDSASATSANDTRKILRTISSLEALTPDNPLIASTRTTLANKLSAAALNNGKTSGDWDAALTEIKSVASLFPKAAPVQAAQKQIENERQSAIAAAKAQQLDSLKSELAGLVSKNPDNAWSKKTTALLSDIASSTAADDPWVVDMRNQLTDVYLEEAAKLESSQRFTLAGQQLDRAANINPKAPAIKTARDKLKVSLANFRNEQREKDLAARIDAHKQTFTAHIKSKQVGNAKKTLALLQKDLPREDPFVKNVAPALIAGVYRDFAKSKNDQKAYADAIKFAESGLQYQPKDSELLALLKDAKKGMAASAKPAPVVAEKPIAKPAPKAVPVAPPAPVAAPTIIAKEQIFGDWCSDNIKLTLASNNFTFHLPGGGKADYPVKGYDFSKETFTVQWADKKQGTMETEFGKLGSDNNSLTQIRGRKASESKWNNYNREFRRCR